MFPRALTTLVLILLALPFGSAQAEAPRPALVEIAQFDCPRCRKVEEKHLERLRQAADRAGWRFRVAPIPTGQQAWRERIYYASRELGGDFPEKVREAFYAAQDYQDEPMKDRETVVSWLTIQVPDVAWRAFVAEQVTKPKHREAVNRALFLANQASTRSTPAFVLVTAGEVVPVPASGKAEERVSQVIQFVKENRDQW